jgi:hypothetical protein
MRHLHDVHKVNAHRAGKVSVRMIELQYLWTDLG